MKTRLIAAMVGLTAFVLLVHDVPLVGHLWNVERDRLVTRLEVDAFTIAGRSALALAELDATGTTDVSGISDLLQNYSASTGGRVLVTDEEGLAVASSDEESVNGRNYSTRPEIEGALAGVPTIGDRESVTLGIDLVYVAVPVIVGDEVLGSIRITYPSSVIDDRVTSRLGGIVAAAVVSILVAVAVAFVLANTVTRPLRRLTDTTDRLEQEDFSVEADEESGPAEIKSLARSFNRMRSRLGGLIERQRGFAGDASHQLRTPLTALRLRLEQVDMALETDPASARDKLDAALRETDRLHDLIDGLLALARAEAKNDQIVTVDVSRIVHERVESWSALSAELGVSIVADTADGLTVRAMDGVLDQILDNFVDNAVEHSPAGTTVEIVGRAEGDQIAVGVLDRGPGMTPEQCARATDRFWRAPDAPAGGTGLGLAIATRLAEACGGSIEVRPRDGGGLEVRVLLRRATDDPSR